MSAGVFALLLGKSECLIAVKRVKYLHSLKNFAY